MAKAATEDDRILYSQAEAARILNVCDKTVYWLRRKGKLPFVMVASRPKYRRSDLLAYVEANLTPATA